MPDVIGQLRHRLKLATKVVTRNADYGDEVKTWTLSDYIFCRAEFLTVGSDEQMSSAQRTNRTTVRFTIRYRDSLSTTQKIAFKGKYYEIESVLPDEKYCYLTLEAYQMGEYNTFADAVQDGSWIDPNGDPWLTPDGDPWLVPDA